MDVKTQVALADFAASHPELHHYTNFGGLEGIHKSQTVWATNYRHLNDTKEVVFLKEPLEKAVRTCFCQLFEHRYRTSPQFRNAIEETGGGIPAIAAGQAARVVKAYYETSFQGNAPLDIYITSFCAHTNDSYA